MFLGTFTLKLLGSAQVVLPAKLRGQLPDRRAVLAKGFDKCVYGFTIDTWQKLAEQELLKPLLTTEGRRMRQQVFSQAEEVDCDKQGRFVVPTYLRDYAGIREEIVIIGAGVHFEIWDKDEWDNLSNSGTFK